MPLQNQVNKLTAQRDQEKSEKEKIQAERQREREQMEAELGRVQAELAGVQQEKKRLETAMIQSHAESGDVREAEPSQSRHGKQPLGRAAPQRKALTWKKVRHDDELGIDLVGTSGGNSYVGDTDISEALPILAIRICDAPRPNYALDGRSHAMPKQYYRGWSGGEIALTPPIRGYLLTSQEVADEFCRAHCGEGFRMAEFHDGKYVAGMDKDRFHGVTWPGPNGLNTGGWNFWAYGNITDDSRFWVRISDQPANCWSK